VIGVSLAKVINSSPCRKGYEARGQKVVALIIEEFTIKLGSIERIIFGSLF
jgi:hypothetical protein